MYEYSLTNKQSIFLLLYQVIPCIEIIHLIYNLMDELQTSESILFYTTNLKQSCRCSIYTTLFYHDINLILIHFFSSSKIQYLPTHNNKYINPEQIIPALQKPTFHQKIISIQYILYHYKNNLYDLPSVINNISLLIIDKDNHIFW